MSLCDDGGSRLEMDTMNIASLSASSPCTGGGDESPDNIISLEREFQQVRQHIKLLVQRKARLLQKIHKHKAGDNEQQQQHIIDRWKEVVARYLYAYNEDVLVEDDDHTSARRFPIFNMLPNEVILQVFSYLDATHLCRTVMRTCTLFCAIALDESLWRPLYHLSWGDHKTHFVYSKTVDHAKPSSEERGEGGERRVEEEGGEQLLTWRGLFTQQSCTESNWWRGRYSVNTLDGHKVLNIHIAFLFQASVNLFSQQGGCKMHVLFRRYSSHGVRGQNSEAVDYERREVYYCLTRH